MSGSCSNPDLPYLPKLNDQILWYLYVGLYQQKYYQASWRIYICQPHFITLS